MGLLSKDDLHYYLSQLGAYFAFMLRDNPDDIYKELYSHYDAVREHIQTLEKTNGWISVKDKLPKGECIAYSSKFGEMMMGYIGETDEGDTGYCCDSNTEWLGDVTHWMPLPEPPEEG